MTPTPMTLKEAQALECNGCGDCCDSRRLAKQGIRFGWGSTAGRDDLIISLREVHEGVFEDDVLHANAEDYSPFRCASLEPQSDGRALCDRHDKERPLTCNDFPVFGSHAASLMVSVETSETGSAWTSASKIPRCTWFDVYIIPEAGYALPEVIK